MGEGKRSVVFGRSFGRAGFVGAAALALAVSVAAGARLSARRPVPSAPPSAHAEPRRNESLLRFERNEGQFDERVRFLARGRDCMTLLTDGDVRLALRQSKDDDSGVNHGNGQPARRRSPAAITPFDESVIALRVVGGRRVSPVEAEPLAGVTNYFVGTDKSKWRTDVSAYGRIRYPEVLPGIDVAFHGGGEGRLEYDVVVAAGQDPQKVALAFDGATSIALAPSGEAVLGLASGLELREQIPVAYQTDASGARTEVPVRYELRSDRTLAFAVGPHDFKRPLVIDPVLAYSTYHGGNGADVGTSIALDATGAAYVTGATSSPNFEVLGPLSGGTALAGASDAFVTKFSPSGAYVYSTYFGGSGSDGGSGIAVDITGSAYIAGGTDSTNLPFASNTLGGRTDTFVVQLNPAGNAVVYSRYLGGSNDDASLWPPSIAVGIGGEAFVAGTTMSTNFPVAFPAQATNGGSQDAFFTRLAPFTGGIEISTYIGGSNVDQANGIVVDASTGTAYITGHTASSNFPLMPVAAREHAFVVKINPGGTFGYVKDIGGSGEEIGSGIAIDAAQNAYVTGSTTSADFLPPLPAGVTPFQAVLKGTSDAFVTKLDPAGNLLYATFLGGNDDLGTGTGEGNSGGIAVDRSGNMFVTGATSSSNFPTQFPLPGLGAHVVPGVDDAYVTELNPSGSALVFSTFLGGTGEDAGHHIAQDTIGGMYITGTTSSTNFPTAAAAQPTSGGGVEDAFVTKIGAAGGGPPRYVVGNSATTCPGNTIATGGTLPVPATVPPLSCPGCVGGNYTFTGGALDVLRVLYAGYHHDGTYDCNSGVRHALAKSWPSLFASSCAGQAACPGITHAWREADGAAVTTAFISLVGFGGRTIPGVNPFCNSADANTGVASAVETADNADKDPVRIPCDPNDTVCEKDGTLGLVLPIVLPPSLAITTTDLYPPNGNCPSCILSQTGGGNAVPCPNGGPLFLGRCFQPATTAGDTHCIVSRSKRCFGDPPGNDGRSYNLPLKVVGGAEPAKYLTDDNNQRVTGAFFRIHMNAPASSFPSGPTCQYTDADLQIGCLVSSDACTLGDAGLPALSVGGDQAL
jgi:hypothetical protein